MELYETLKKQFQPNEPILLKDLAKNRKRDDALRQSLSRLVKNGFLNRYSQGIYFLPEKTKFGTTIPDIFTVLDRKYLRVNGKRSGFLIGASLLNDWGLSPDVPLELEVVSNEESSLKRNVELGSTPLLLRRSLTPINEDNWRILRFCYLLYTVDVWTIKRNAKKLKQIADQEGVSLSSIGVYLRFFPTSATKNFIESGLLNEFCNNSNY
jgi:hypothetical protein